MDGTGNIKLPVENCCPECNAPVKRFTQSQASYIACAACGAFLAVDRKGVISKTKSKARKWNSPHYSLKPGIKGKFEGKDFVIISAIEKADGYSREFSWREYTLFHPVNGYLWVSEFDGHWLLLKRIPAPVRYFANGKVKYEGREYQLFQKSKSVVIGAIGEFQDKVYNKSVTYEEYISPPYLISYEGSKSYNECFLGEYIEPDFVAEAFTIDKSLLPERKGVGAAQMRNAKYTNKTLFKLFWLFFGLVVLIQILFSGSANEKQVALISHNNLDTAAAVSAPFTLDEGYSNLEFNYQCNVSNNWSEADVMLVNDLTGEVRGLTIGVEYYSGYDGEAWSEGETESQIVLSGVSAGRYHINVKSTHGTSGSGGDQYYLRVINDVPLFSNMFYTILLMLIFPLIHRWREYQFEKSRWENSDYSPYYSSEE